MFDPWNSTVEEAIEHEKLHDDPKLVRPTSQICGVASINAAKREVEAGDGFSIMACISECLNFQLIAPDWLVVAFNKRYGPIESRLVKSWDDPKSFGKPFAKGSNLSALRKKRNYQMKVWIEVQKLRLENPNMPIDGNLFEEVGRKYGLGKTLTSEYYYEVQKMRGK